MKNFSRCSLGSLSVSRKNSSPPSQPGGKRGGTSVVLWPLKDEFGLDPSASLAARGQVASFIAAWKASKVRVQRQAEVEAEQDAREWTKPIPTAEYLLLRQAYVKAHGTLDERVLPSKEFLEKKLQEVEHGEFKAESLQEVTTRDELDPDTLVPVWDSKGVMIHRTLRNSGDA